MTLSFVLLPDFVVYFGIFWVSIDFGFWPAQQIHTHLHLEYDWVCVLESRQGVGTRPQASMGKHKLQTVEISGVQTGHDPEQDPAFLCNHAPGACCLCWSLRGRGRGAVMENWDIRWDKRGSEDLPYVTHRYMNRMTKNAEVPQRDIPGLWAVFRRHHLCICRMHKQFAGSSSSFLLHDS